MKLLTSPASPFGSKVKLFASRLGLLDQIQIEPVDTIGMAKEGSHPNPLGKIPCLILTDGRSVFDSQVICDFLAARANKPELLAPSLDDRINLAAITGLTEAALLIVYEGRMRPADQQNPEWVQMQQEKMERTLEWISDRLPSNETVVGAALAAALSYLDLRFDGVWRQHYQSLAAWQDGFSSEMDHYEALKPH